MPEAVALTLPDELVERIAEQAAALVLERLQQQARPEVSPYMTCEEVAAYLRTSRQAVDDLLRRGKLTRHKRGEGRNAPVLVLRREVEQQVHTTRHEEVAEEKVPSALLLNEEAGPEP